jgi:hypothetical protein
VAVDDNLVFRARALAQAHPLSAAASGFLREAMAREEANQPAPELAWWAGAAFTSGYCLRRVEEADAGVVLPAPWPSPGDEELARLTAEVAAALRSGGAASYLLQEEASLIAALDRLIAGEVARRREALGDGLAVSTLHQLEDLLAWWVVRGYALRTAEVALVSGKDL